MEFTCIQCSVTFNAPPSQARKYCTRECLAVAIKGKPRKPWSEESKAKVRGPNSPHWKGGPERPAHLARFTPEYYAWQRAVFERDGHTCQDCGFFNRKGMHLHAHHLELFSVAVEKRFEVSNGRTLCRDCHDALHGKTPTTEPRPCACGCGEMLTTKQVRVKTRYMPHHAQKFTDPEARARQSAKQSATTKGRPHSEAHRAALTEARRRRTYEPPLTEIHKERIGAGVRRFWEQGNEASRAKMSEASAGARNPNAKLSDADVAAIRERYASGKANQPTLAAEFGVSQAHISRLILRQNR